MDRSTHSTDSSASDSSASRSAGTPARSGITLRSVLLATLGIALISAAGPFNDYVVGNSFLVGSYLPPVLVLFIFVLVVLINAPLRRFAPSRALRSGELAVMLAMMLVGCSVPGQGLLRAAIPMLVAPLYHSQTDPTLWTALKGMGLPSWFLIAPADESGRASTLVSWFYGRAPDDQPVPYGAWLVPLMGWGVFVAGMFAALMGLASILRVQWSHNERLNFPLADLQAQLIQDPPAGRLLNDLFRNRLFWLAAAAVFVLHATEVLNGYYPKIVPEIPTRFDLRGILADPPLSQLSFDVKVNRLFFVFVGVMYLAPTRVSFSIWSIFLILQGIALVLVVGTQREVAMNVWLDQHLGGSIAWALLILWLGRAHWVAVIGQFVRKPDPEADQRLPAIAAAVGLIIMFAWLAVVGVSVPVIVVIIGFILLTHLTIARIVAESGLPIIRSTAAPLQVLTLLPASTFSSKDVMLAGLGNTFGPYMTRESVAAFTQQGAQLVERTLGRRIASGTGLFALMGWALLVACLVGAASSITAYYRFDIPLAASGAAQVINKHALIDQPQGAWIQPVNQHARGAFIQRRPDPAIQFALGAGTLLALQLLTMRFAGWPFVPIGFIVATSPFGGWIWFSALIGWLAKSLIVRFGGAGLMDRMRPLFIGMILGSVLAVGFWTIFNLVRLALHLPYLPVRFLPT